MKSEMHKFKAMKKRLGKASRAQISKCWSPALLYSILGIAWTIGSNFYVHGSPIPTTDHSTYEVVKDWIFLFISSILIMGLCKWNKSELMTLHTELESNYQALSETHRDLVHQKHLVEEIFNTSNSIILVWSLSGEIVNINNRFSEITGYGDEIIGQYWPSLLVLPSHSHKVEALIQSLKNNPTQSEVENCIVAKDGTEHCILWSNAIIEDPFVDKLVVVSFGTDITAEKEKDAEIDKLITSDTLTSLGNRQSFENDLKSFIEYNNPFTVYFMGIDNFRAINEIYGHKVGDAYLKRISGGFSKLPNCKAYRWSGDEFVFLQGAPAYASERFISEVQSIVTKKRHVMRYKIESTCCVGTTRYPEHGKTFESVVQNMTISLEKAKSLGKNQWAEFDEHYKEKLTEHMRVTDAIEDALIQNDFELNFQPIFEMNSLKIRKFEVLLRWPNNPSKNMNIGDVIALSEQNGQILSIDKWVVDQAFKFIVKLGSIWSNDKVLSINISAQSFHSDEFLEFLKKSCHRLGVNPAHIELEITEYSLIKDFKSSKRVIDELKQLGFKLSLDDFGTEYSSLNYLRQLPFDTLKIDKSFIDCIEAAESVNHVIIEHVVQMAKAMHISTVAEGIETEYQRSFLDKIHCDYGQGYLISKPLSPDKTLLLLQKESSEAA